MAHKSNEKVKKEQKVFSAGHNLSAVIKKAIQEIEGLEEDKKEIGEAIKQVKADLKEQGVPTRAINMWLRLRKLDKAVRQDLLLEVGQVAIACGDQFSFMDMLDGKGGKAEAMPAPKAAAAPKTAVN